MPNLAESSLQRAPDSMVAQLEQVAMEHYESENFDRAAEHVEMLVKLRPHNVNYHSLLGCCYRRMNLKVKALLAFKRAVELDAGDKNSLINLAETLAEVGKIKEAVDLMREIFLSEYDPKKPAEEQDYFTKRAGMQLAVIKGILEGYAGMKRHEIKEAAEQEKAKAKEQA